MWSTASAADFRCMTTSRLIRAALGALAASAALAAPAHASLLAPAADCDTPVLTQPFAAWGDTASYKLVDAFEDGAAGWGLTGGARVVTDNQPWGDGARALVLPLGSTATSPPVCVGHDEPTLRFFGRGTGLLTVSVQFQLVTGTWLTLPVGTDLGTAWSPSPVIGMVANYLPDPGQYTAVRFVFTPVLGAWRVDDVYVDPRKSY
jgi:hypothetical protein